MNEYHRGGQNHWSPRSSILLTSGDKVGMRRREEGASSVWRRRSSQTSRVLLLQGCWVEFCCGRGEKRGVRWEWREAPEPPIFGLVSV